jgi:indolepyruvate ferredoxin oxidoreductase alpha subunit
LQEETKKAVKDAKEAREPFVIVTTEPCALMKDVQERRKNSYVSINQEECKKCKTCVRTGCPAIYIKDGNVMINREMCNGCTLCFQVCPFHAIEKKGDLIHA